jgi:hypothetical protein
MAEGSLEDGVNPPEQVVDAGLLLHGTNRPGPDLVEPVKMMVQASSKKGVRRWN